MVLIAFLIAINTFSLFSCDAKIFDNGKITKISDMIDTKPDEGAAQKIQILERKIKECNEALQNESLNPLLKAKVLSRLRDIEEALAKVQQQKSH